MMLHQHRRHGRVFWSATTAWYIVRIDGDGSTWYATIINRDTGKMVEYLDRDQFGNPFATRQLVTAAAEAYVIANKVPA